MQVLDLRKDYVEDFELLLESSARSHGHLCPGQVIGVRMALLGSQLIGIRVPADEEDIKRFVVYVEMDRCATDAISHVTGVKLGRRSLKFVDYGIMAATFVRLDIPIAYRVLCTEESREMAPLYAPEIKGKYAQQLEAYKRMSDRLLFKVFKVSVELQEWDLPGPSKRKVTCSRCGQVVRDGKEVWVKNEPLCVPCAKGAYFKIQEEVELIFEESHKLGNVIGLH